MNIENFEDENKVRLISKELLPLMRLIGFLFPSFMKRFTTYRMPWGPAIIAYPPDTNPMDYTGILGHEMVHVSQQRTFWGLLKSFFLYFFFPFPVLLSGRWFVERDAYLLDIKSGRMTIDRAISYLWNEYVFPWPPFLMRRWFNARLQ